jgi:hypothetical protein
MSAIAHILIIGEKWWLVNHKQEDAVKPHNYIATKKAEIYKKKVDKNTIRNRKKDKC